MFPFAKANPFWGFRHFWPNPVPKTRVAGSGDAEDLVSAFQQKNAGAPNHGPQAGGVGGLEAGGRRGAGVGLGEARGGKLEVLK